MQITYGRGLPRRRLRRQVCYHDRSVRITHYTLHSTHYDKQYKVSIMRQLIDASFQECCREEKVTRSDDTEVFRRIGVRKPRQWLTRPQP